jgi:hypothetical protein
VDDLGPRGFSDDSGVGVRRGVEDDVLDRIYASRAGRNRGASGAADAAAAPDDDHNDSLMDELAEIFDVAEALCCYVLLIPCCFGKAVQVWTTP